MTGAGALHGAGSGASVCRAVPRYPASGELRFYEHVVSHANLEARFQRLADATFWPCVAGGCHLARDTTAGIEQAGLVIETCERIPFSPAAFLPPDPHILGVARRP